MAWRQSKRSDADVGALRIAGDPADELLQFHTADRLTATTPALAMTAPCGALAPSTGTPP